MSYAGSTGKLRLIADEPGLFIERAGAAKDPWPSDETLRSLRGRGAGRAIRALVAFCAPYGVRELAQRAGVALGSLSRVLGLLAREGLVTRESSGAVTAIDWERTIRRRAQDYDFAHSNQTATFLEPRGLDAVASKLSGTKGTYAATGALGAQRFAPIAPARQAAIYTDDTARTAERLRLRPTDTGANVVLAEPYDPVVFDRSTAREAGSMDRRRIATLRRPPYATGAGSVEGNELLDWMRTNEDAWRA